MGHQIIMKPFKNKSAANNGRNPPSYVSLTPFPKIPYINEEATGCINEKPVGAIRKQP